MNNIRKIILKEINDFDWAKEYLDDIGGIVTTDNVYVGMRVSLDPESMYAGQSKGNGGTVIHIQTNMVNGDYWCEVKWDRARWDAYRIGPHNFDLFIE